MATAGPWTALPVALHPETLASLAGLGFPNMTPVQATAVPPLLSHKDVVVDAETGSGKSLSFLVPALELSRAADRPGPVALVVEPTRELARQVFAVAQALFGAACEKKKTGGGGGGAVVLLVGKNAKSGKEKAKAAAEAGVAELASARVVVGTPGRILDAIEAGDLHVKALELLVLDEADRLLDLGFETALNSILSALPKQRRTGLYSATQTTRLDELSRVGLRNPVAVSVRRHRSAPDASDPSQPRDGVTPSSLACFHVEVSGQDVKWPHLAGLLRGRKKEKVIVYFLTCACVDLYARMAPLLEVLGCGGEGAGKGREVFALHGKMLQKKRVKALEMFAKSEGGILFCTDVAARGLDIPDVDIVVQFDPPQDPDSYIHRVGRTARLGRNGTSFLYLTPKEDNYLDFLKVRKCYTEEYKTEFADEIPALKSKLESDVRIASIVQRLPRSLTSIPSLSHSSPQCKTVVISDRAVYESGKHAFLTFIRAYKEHRCHHVLPFSKLDLGAVARSFFLVHLPHMKELERVRHKIDFVADTSVKAREIGYKDKEVEKRRRKIGEERRAEDEEKKKKRSRERVFVSKEEWRYSNAELSSDMRMLKKFKKGKISAEDLDTALAGRP